MTITDAFVNLIGEVPDDLEALLFFMCCIAFLMFLSWIFDLIYVVLANMFFHQRR